MRNVTRFNEAVLPKLERAARLEIFIGLAKAFAARTGVELKPTMAPQQMIDMGLQLGPYGDQATQAQPGGAARCAPHGIDLGPLKANLAARASRRPAGAGRAALLLLGDLSRCGKRSRPVADAFDRFAAMYAATIPGCTTSAPPPGEGQAVTGCWSPDDLAARGLDDGQQVQVRSRVGSVEVEVAGSDEVMRGVVSLPHGWGTTGPGCGWPLPARSRAPVPTT